MSRPSRPALDRSGYLGEDTIAALTTAVGGAISMLRLSGPDAYAFFERVSDRRASEMEPRKLVRARIHDLTGKPLDDALAARFVAESSYTGEASVEIHLHGGSFIASRVLSTLLEAGARQALPGEFSFRAVRNGKLSLPQAEAVADLIEASNDGAVALALDKMSGAQTVLLGALAAELRQLATLGEVGIDFADQDVDEVALERLQSRLAPVRGKLEQLRASYGRGAKIQEGIRVAFVGLPNAGKSSLFNALLGEDRSIVSEVAGTTRDVVREKLSLQGSRSAVTLRLEDTAGLRSADDRVERMGIERTLRSAREAELILLIVEAGSSPTDAAELREQWKDLGEPSARTLGLVTKCDLADGSGAQALFEELGVASSYRTSAQSGEGVAEAARGIADFCENWVQRAPGEVLLTRLDHLRAVEHALEHLDRARQAAEIDLFAADLRHSLGALAPLIGETLPDDILGQIFSKFCIGK
jgi:tRNA modification GTPase